MRTAIIVVLTLLSACPLQEVITTRRRAVSGGGGGTPSFMTTEHCVNTGTPNPSCSATAVGGETFIVTVVNFGGSGSVSDSNGTLTLCPNYPVTFASSPPGTVQMYKETSAAAGGHTFTFTPGSSSFPIIMVLAASTSSSIQCDGSTLFAALGSGATVATPAFTNSANSLVLCFAGPAGADTLTPSGSSFTFNAVDTGGSGYSVSAEGSITGAGSNFCEWNALFPSNSHFAAAAVLN